MSSLNKRGVKRGGSGKGNEPGAGPAPKQQKLTETCAICLLPFREPALTLCGHIFCFPCLKQLVNNSTVFPRCPLCRRSL